MATRFFQSRRPRAAIIRRFPGTRVLGIIRLVLLSLVVLTQFSCSYENTQIGEPEVIYLIGQDLSPYYVLVFESKWAKNAAFVVNASSGTINWTSTCMQFEKNSKTYNCSKPFVIPFHDSKAREIEVNISYNNEKTRRTAMIRNPYYYFLSEEDRTVETPTVELSTDAPAYESGGGQEQLQTDGKDSIEAVKEVPSEDVKDDTAEVAKEAAGSVGSEPVADEGYDGGAGAALDGAVVAGSAEIHSAEVESLMKEQEASDSETLEREDHADLQQVQPFSPAEPASPSRKDDPIWKNRDKIAESIGNLNTIFKATSSKLSGVRIGIYLDEYSSSKEIYYGIQKLDGEISNSARLTSKTTRANITSTSNKLILVEKVNSIFADDEIYFFRTVDF